MVRGVSVHVDPGLFQALRIHRGLASIISWLLSGVFAAGAPFRHRMAALGVLPPGGVWAGLFLTWSSSSMPSVLRLATRTRSCCSGVPVVGRVRCVGRERCMCSAHSSVISFIIVRFVSVPRSWLNQRVRGKEFFVAKAFFPNTGS